MSKKYIKHVMIKVTSNKKKALKWAVECIWGDIEAQNEIRKKDVDGDPNISIEKVEM